MPEQLAHAGAHRRVIHAVAEAAAGIDDAGRALDGLAIRALAVEHEPVVLVPDLRVARERLVVEIDRDRLGREQRDRDLIGVRAIAVDVGVARDALPAVRARDVRDHAMPVLRVHGRVVLVEPARLRDPDRAALLDPRKQMEQRNLHRPRQVRRELAIARVLEEHQVGSSRVDLQACKLEYSIVSPK